ncbi:helix-turn-helix domain-containing protein [Parafrankia sp. BMG5.11]|uniref:helix-turn-helix domain-containing protein n=1 Tax=Parafrankia sp. BMG5.11 TaxID=222540 RepID=UPI00103E1175|nr:helix-turn-helix domain-containing protein [Parafrankia sp. BMG5.11]TCJ41471.1 helix-turn-helix domain-containing protein [Parafrankia sp. BMG5.11]
MNEETSPPDGQLPLHGVGDRLRMAREQQGLTLAQLSAETRIPARHLALIEKGEFAGLPAKTYATGFARTYAKAVGLDQRAVVEEVRAELARSHGGDRYRAASFEPGDPARIPSRGLALFSLAALILLLVGGVMFYNRVLAPGSGPGSLLEEERLAAQNAKANPPAAARPGEGAARPAGPVVFTALEDGVWVKFYDGTGAQLMQKQMARGERYTVPAEATGPQVWTGRPDALAITVGGKPVPKLAESEGIIRDVPVTAQALLARGQAAAAAAPAAGPTGT